MFPEIMEVGLNIMKKTDTKKKNSTLFSYLWSAPSLLLISLIVIFPIVYTGYILSLIHI